MNFKKFFSVFLSLALVLLLGSKASKAATAGEIDASVKATLDKFYAQASNGREVIANAKGVLVFPKILKAGFVFGAEYGEGALQIAGQNIEYYSISSGSFGWQLGAQQKSIIMIFMDETALGKLRASSNWSAGIDASVALIAIGVNGSIDTDTLNKPVVAIAIDQKGLMYNLTLEGSKITKLNKV
jgi:lipid-binding SYLF domain-containing protein